MTNNSVVKDLVLLPWWFSVVLAAVIFVLTKIIMPALPIETPFFKPFVSAVSTTITPMICIGLLLISAASALRQALTRGSRKKLIQQQTGIDSLLDLSWDDFERLVGELYRRKGFKVIENSNKGADGGVDLRLYKDRKLTLVQCKHWKNNNKVGVSVVRELLGSMTSEGASAGIVAASGEFTNDAVRFAKKNPVQLVDGAILYNLLAFPRSYETKETTERPSGTTCPKCAATMVKRTAKRGAHKGRQFLGCSRFPECREIVNI